MQWIYKHLFDNTNYLHKYISSASSFMDSKSWHCSNNLGTILQPGFKLIPKSIISLLQCTYDAHVNLRFLYIFGGSGLLCGVIWEHIGNTWDIQSRNFTSSATYWVYQPKKPTTHHFFPLTIIIACNLTTYLLYT